uniref:Ig-like domain-containing protein n=1 Tax=Dicentrarchus labrax TaxID=13489 RepID=A0A8C4F0E5_DICLA
MTDSKHGYYYQKSLIDGSDVTQTDILWKNESDSATIECSHTKGFQYYQMYWYRQLPGETMKLIPYNVDFNITGDLGGNTAKNGSLIVNFLRPSHSAVYYCASEAYFGAGTKLTVLEKDKEITEPTVEVLRPSPTECRNEQRNKTLVCVATGFYPDHVSISWQISGVGVTKGVATDEAAQWMPGKTFYQITSRLKVSEEDWYNPKNQFNCTVNFYNGNDTVPYTDSIRGEGIVFIVKSCIYGAFVVFLVWKLQVCSTQCSM